MKTPTRTVKKLVTTCALVKSVLPLRRLSNPDVTANVNKRSLSVLTVAHQGSDGFFDATDFNEVK